MEETEKQPPSPVKCPNCEHMMEEGKLEGNIIMQCTNCGYWEAR